MRVLCAADVQRPDDDRCCIFYGFARIAIDDVVPCAAALNSDLIAGADTRITLPQILIAFAADLVNIDLFAGTVKEFASITDYIRAEPATDVDGKNFRARWCAAQQTDVNVRFFGGQRRATGGAAAGGGHALRADYER